jgi:DNA-directed RNA polymerase subunit omega
MTNQALDGITNPPIDALLEKAGSKYSLVLYAAKRARQINAYYSQLGEGLLECAFSQSSSLALLIALGS